jgi:hypothetical protein
MSAQRLAIVVPYRRREDHLAIFVPKVSAYLNKTDIPYRVTVVEQADERKPFNRGAIKNIGFLLTRDESDYVAFHDVDYWPVCADYSFPQSPTCIVWEAGTKLLGSNLALFFGAVVLVSNKDFAAVNGYSNDYWQWGFEDNDLRRRFLLHGIEPARRRGAFTPLDHPTEGSTKNYQMSSAVFRRKWDGPHASDLERDGISTVRYDVIGSRLLAASVGLVSVRVLNSPF